LTDDNAIGLPAIPKPKSVAADLFL